MTTLLLVRHGETVDNARQVMQGQTQGELNEVGIRQARELAVKLQDEAVDAFVSSDLRRAVDTCAILAAPHCLPVVTTPLLRERDWGGFTGCFIPGLKGREWPDDIESLDALLRRARSFLDYVRTSFPGQCVVAVGHGIINKAIQAVYHDRQMPEVERMTNCEVRRLELR
jgi:probable phosphoglycerate mutase